MNHLRAWLNKIGMTEARVVIVVVQRTTVMEPQGGRESGLLGVGVPAPDWTPMGSRREGR